LKNLFYF